METVPFLCWYCFIYYVVFSLNCYFEPAYIVFNQCLKLVKIEILGFQATVVISFKMSNVGSNQVSWFTFLIINFSFYLTFIWKEIHHPAKTKEIDTIICQNELFFYKKCLLWLFLFLVTFLVHNVRLLIHEIFEIITCFNSIFDSLVFQDLSCKFSFNIKNL